MTETQTQFVFGLYRLDVKQRVLTRNGEVNSRGPKELDTLLVLVENNGRLVTQEELIFFVWPKTFVGDGSLARNIFVLGIIFGKAIVQTVAERGYRFVAAVEAAETLPLPNKMLNLHRDLHSAGLTLLAGVLSSLAETTVPTPGNVLRSRYLRYLYMQAVGQTM